MLLIIYSFIHIKKPQDVHIFFFDILQDVDNI